MKDLKIKPDDSTYQVLRKLSSTPQRYCHVYDIDNEEENRLYGKMHEFLWNMHKDGLIEYERSKDDTNYMLAKIKMKGIDWYKDRKHTRIHLILTILALISGMTAAITGIIQLL